MGAFQSLLEPPNCQYSHTSKPTQCHSCGTLYNPNESGPVDSRSLRLYTHHPAILCGIRLGRSDQLQNDRDLDHRLQNAATPPGFSNPFCGARANNTLPSTGLPKRTIAGSKPYQATDTLFRHTAFTKKERCALKRGFFSTVDVCIPDAADSSQLEGCHIHGCLFVEHGNLVFQATDNSTGLPYLLTLNLHPSNFIPSGDRIATDRQSDLTDHGVHNCSRYKHKNGRSQSRLHLHPSSIYHRAKRRLVAYLRDNYRVVSKTQLHCECQQRLFPKSAYVYTDPNKRHCEHQPNLIHGHSTGSDSVSVDFQHDSLHFPPPPLRLCWPLFTLRRFGFYGNSLFKLEAGRRAPRGEGHYLFIIKGLTEFRRYFEQYVHRRKSLSSLVPDHPMFQKQWESIRDPNLNGLKPSSRLCQSDLQVSLLASTMSPSASAQAHMPTEKKSTVDTVAGMQVLNLSDNNQAKKKTCSLSSPPVRQYSVSPTCLHWVHQQQTHAQSRSVSFQNSCPQLTAPSPLHGAASQSSHHVRGEDSESDEISTLPDPPPPPFTDGTDEQAASTPVYKHRHHHSHPIYDNISVNCLRSTPVHSSTVTRRFTTDFPPFVGTDCSGAVMPFSLSQHAGRQYTSRRAMTALGCTSRYPSSLRRCAEEDEDGVACPPTTSQSGCHRIHGHQSPPLVGQCRTSDTRRRNEKVKMNPFRHASLPSPLSLFDVHSTVVPEQVATQSSQVAYFHTSPDDSSFPYVSAADNGDEVEAARYYNLNSSEVLHHCKKTRSLTRTGSAGMECGTKSAIRTRGGVRLSASSVSWNSALKVSGSRVEAADASSLGRTTTGHEGLMPEGLLSDASPSESMISPRPLTTNRSHSLLQTVEPRQSTSNILHYATLDFGHPTLTAAEPVVSTTTCIRETHSHESCVVANCPVHAYGTLVPGTLENIGRVGHEAPVEASVTQDAAVVQQDAAELPTNYVAICQLQTLAMSAVLNATT
ncbi:hypothetical protein CSKR_101522 [Clonorchis sinensis]|uniref:IRS-type PTB domain-containing protein n=1 Tax=Clonorchis sinensis TaxID=79923 RepID=A0A419PRZ4_CLOSI|nr:hypothetical protein CSKR_101522 [Clonorchis sinensis]KAG5449529.1 hypothetical protein CSKR_101522 [Clonorchis sinensis]